MDLGKNRSTARITNPLVKYDHDRQCSSKTIRTMQNISFLSGEHYEGFRHSDLKYIKINFVRIVVNKCSFSVTFVKYF